MFFAFILYTLFIFYVTINLIVKFNFITQYNRGNFVVKSSLNKGLTVCLFASLLGNYSTTSGYAYNSGGDYKYVVKNYEYEEDIGDDDIAYVIAKVLRSAVVAFVASTVIGAGIDIYKNGGYKGSKTENFVGKAVELAKNTYFVPKELIASKVLPKIESSEDFGETKKYLKIKDGSDATLVGEVKGLGNVIKELGNHIWNLIKGK